MRVTTFFEALKQAFISRLGRAVLDDIEHGQKLLQVERLRELETIRQEARIRGEDSVLRELDHGLNLPPSDGAQDALAYFDAVIDAAHPTRDEDVPFLEEKRLTRKRSSRKASE